MKDVLNLVFFVIFCFSLAACNSGKDNNVVDDSDSTFTLEGAGE